MRLTRKFTLALVLGMCTVMAVYGMVRVRAALELFEEDIKSDHRALGTALGISVAEIWQIDGEARALGLISRMNKGNTGVRVRWIWLDPKASDFFQPKADPRQLIPLAHGKSMVWINSGEGDAGWLYSYIPTRVPDARTGALELSESLAPQRQYALKSILAITAATGAIVVLFGVMAMVLGLWLVGRPVQMLVEKARRVGEGDFSGELPTHQRDELGELAREMNAMSGRLSETSQRLSSETAARLFALTQLRHGERLMTVGQLASGIAHELGTPLNVVSLHAQMIAAGEVTGDDVHQSAKAIGEQSLRMATIIRQLLDFARPRKAEISAVNVMNVTEKTLQLLRPVAEKKSVRLILDISADGDRLWVNADAGQLQQVLTNLVMNAIQAMPRGGDIRVSTSLHNTHAPDSPTQEIAPYVRIEVRDHGTGIDSQDLPHIFDPFFSTKGVGEGTGLGLSVSYGMIKEQGGWITVHSIQGSGSSFYVFLALTKNHDM